MVCFVDDKLPAIMMVSTHLHFDDEMLFVLMLNGEVAAQLPGFHRGLLLRSLIYELQLAAAMI